MRFSVISGAALAAALTLTLTLTACGNGESAVETRDRSADAGGLVRTGLAAAADASGSGDEEKRGLTASRRETVDDKIQRLYDRNGADFDARSPADFLDKVTAFTTRPPSGTETAARPNGDILLYQASTNTFAVVARDGTPRTMFKPTDGPAYWAEQKAAAPTFGQRRSED